MSPCLIRYQDRSGAVSVVLGHPLLDDYLEFVAGRSRTNTLLATAYDLKVFFAVVAKSPSEVTTADVLAFVTAQRRPRSAMRRWCVWPTGRRACRRGRSSGGCRASRGRSAI